MVSSEQQVTYSSLLRQGGCLYFFGTWVVTVALGYSSIKASALIHHEAFKDSGVTRAVESKAVLVLCTIVLTFHFLVILRTTWESRDGAELNRVLRNKNALGLQDVVLFNAALSVGLCAPFLSIYLGSPEAFLLFDSSLSFTAVGGLFSVLRARRDVRFAPLVLELIHGGLAIAQLTVYRGLSAHQTTAHFAQTAGGNCLYLVCYGVFFYLTFLMDFGKTRAKFTSGAMFQLNSTDYLTFCNAMQLVVICGTHIALKIAYETFGGLNTFHRASYTPLAIVILYLPSVILLTVTLTKPIRLDAEVKASLDVMIADTINQREQLRVMSARLYKEKSRSEDLLCRMLPKTAVRSLQRGKQVIPQHFNESTIYFSDIQGFSNYCSRLEPIEIMDMLNRLYNLMDFVASLNPLLYKVETIGDAYVVASGLPEENPLHALAVCDFALVLRDCLCLCRCPLDPSNQILMRMGINSWDCIAGVVGTAMPRYCIFGQTMTLASRMESTGVVNKIQISQATAKLIRETGQYIVEERGDIEVKGSGVLKTFWLVGASPAHRFITRDYIVDVQKRASIAMACNDLVTSRNRFIGEGEVCDADTDEASITTSRHLNILLVSDSRVQQKMFRQSLQQRPRNCTLFIESSAVYQDLVSPGPKDKRLISLDDIDILVVDLDDRQLIPKFSNFGGIVVGMTSDYDETTALRRRHRQVAHILAKPINIATLLNISRSCLWMKCAGVYEEQQHQPDASILSIDESEC